MRMQRPFLLFAAIVVCFAYCAVAVCPANGNTHVLYATTNMGNNIASFDTMGRYLGPVIDQTTLPPNYRVDKLRSMVHGPDGNLYVTSARGPYSKIFAVSGNGLLNGTLNRDCTRRFLFEVAAVGPENPYMDHPYGMLFHPEDGSIYVSNQNSVTVTRYVRDGLSKTPTWHPAPVSRGVRDDLPTDVGTPSPVKNSGLFAASGMTTYAMNSVRGIALSPLLRRRLVEGASVTVAAEEGDAATDSIAGAARYYLLVCDVVSNAVHVFHAATGEFLFSLNVRSPIQVAFPHAAFHPSNLAGQAAAVHAAWNEPFVYVTSKDDGMLYKLPFHAGGDKHLAPLTRPEMGKSLSGLYENAGHAVLYVADRNGRKVSVYTTPHVVGSRKGTAGNVETVEQTDFLGYFHVSLPDQPEFLLVTQVEVQRNIPKCYELAPDGSLRYVALCLATDLWLVVIACTVGTLVVLYVRTCLRRQMSQDVHEKQRRISLFRAMEEPEQP